MSNGFNWNTRGLTRVLFVPEAITHSVVLEAIARLVLGDGLKCHYLVILAGIKSVTLLFSISDAVSLSWHSL